MKTFDWRAVPDATKKLWIKNWKWEKHDSLYPFLPEWSCFCIDRYNKSGRTDDKETPIQAVQECENCLGYGFMPIPPSEIWK